MPFQFLHSALLWALPLLAVPLAIHFLNRKRAVPHAFAAMEFILRSARHARKHLQLKSLLLLLLRTLALLCFILALAGLQKGKTLSISVGETLPKSVVVLLDASASMRFSAAKSESVFEQARREIKRLLDGLGEKDEVSLLVFDEAVVSGSGPLHMGRREAGDLLRAVKPGFRGTKISVALKEGLKHFDSALYTKREVHLFTDLAARGWDTENFPSQEVWKKHEGLSILLHDMQKERQPFNLSVNQVEIHRDPSRLDIYTLDAVVENHSARKLHDVPIVLSVSNKEAMRSFQTMDPMQRLSVNFFYHAQEKNALIGSIRVPEDGLSVDNERSFWMKPSARLRVLAVDGDPQPNIEHSETYYLAHALTPLSGENAPLSGSTLTLDEFRPSHLQDQDLVVLANARTLAQNQVESLRQFVRKGGALWLTLGDQVDAEHYNQLFGDLLPAKLRDLRYEEQGISLQALTPDHPLIVEFLREDLPLFESAKFYRYFVLQTSTERNAQVLWRFSSGSPALLSKAYGKGRVALWTTSIDRNWNNFPIQTTFLPFVHSFFFTLSGGDRHQKVYEAEVGERVLIEAEREISRVSILNSSGVAWEEASDWLDGGALGVRYPETQVPGYYRVQFKGKAGQIISEGALFVSVTPTESKLEKLGEEAIANLGLPIISESQISSSKEGKNEMVFAGAVSLTPLLFLLLALLLVSEGMVECL